MNTTPLVSCIMPTADRRPFVPLAIGWFQQQDYANKELVILDDGADSVADLIPEDPCIRYVRLTGSRTLGAKRNECVEASRGDLIMHWDDDDWMAPHRIRSQIEALLRTEAEVCGMQQLLFYNPVSERVWLYQYPKKRRLWLAGGTLLYTRAFWQRAPFPNVQVASDTRFIWSRPLKNYVILPDYRLYVALIHDANTSPKRCRGSYWNPWTGDLRSIMGKALDIYPPTLPSSRAAPPSSPATVRRFVAPGGRAPASSKKDVSARHSNSVPTPHAAVKETRRVTACLLSWKRPQNLKQIVRSLHPHAFIDEILVWNNDPTVSLEVPGAKTRVIPADENMGCYGRFLCARHARNPIIYVQDDDVVVGNVPALYQGFLADPARITHALSTRHHRQGARTKYGACHMALLGWGAFFSKDWLKVFDDVPEAARRLPLFHREADKFFTILLERQHRTVPGRMRHLNGHSTPGVALWREPQHEELKALAVREALRLVRLRRSAVLPVPWNVVIPCYNYARYLREAVTSVLQNDADYTVTIVDDASTDETPEVAEALCGQYPHIRYLRLDENGGPARALNHGIAAVDSAFVVQLDADDRIGPNYLFEAQRVLEKGGDVANPDALLFGTSNAQWKVPQEATLSMLLQRNVVHCAAAFRRGYWVKVGGYDETMPGWQDYEFWIRVAAAGARIQRVAGQHFFYRKHGPSRASASKEVKDQLKAYIQQKHNALFQQIS